MAVQKTTAMSTNLKLLPFLFLFFTSVALSGQNDILQLHQDDGLWGYYSGRELTGTNESPFRLPNTDLQLQGISGSPDLAGRPNGSFYFSHPEDKMVLSNSIQPPHESIAFRFKSDGVSPGMLCGYEKGGFQISLAENGKVDIRLEVSPLAVYHYQSIKNFADGAWHHLVVSFSTEGLMVWLDGQKAYQDNRYATTSSIHFVSNDLYLGHLPGQSNYFNGRLQDIMFYNRALSVAEIRILNAVDRPRFIKRLNSGVVYRTSFNQTPVSNEAKVAVPRTMGNYPFSGFMPGKTRRPGDSAAKLNGLGDQISVKGVIEPTHYSVGGWFSTVSSQPGRLIQLEAGLISLDLNADSSSGQLTLKNGTGQATMVESISLADGGWHHFMLTSDLSEGIRLYLNGKEVLQLPGNLGNPKAGTGIVFGGSDSVFFDGLLDELVVYNRVVTPIEVKALLKASTSLTSNNLQLFDCFPDRSGKALLLVMGNYGRTNLRADVKAVNGTQLVKKWQLSPNMLEVRVVGTPCNCEQAKVTWR